MKTFTLGELESLAKLNGGASVAKEPAVDFFNVVSWGKLAELCGSFLSKGKKVIVDGRIQVRAYLKDGERQWVTEIVAENLKFLEGKKE